MEITVFAKKRNRKDGKTFFSYLARLTKKTGEVITATVRFRDTAPVMKPETCPCIIIVDKTNCQFSSKLITADNGKEYISNTLWIADYAKSDKPYIDTSMDEFM